VSPQTGPGQERTPRFEQRALKTLAKAYHGFEGRSGFPVARSTGTETCSWMISQLLPDLAIAVGNVNLQIERLTFRITSVLLALQPPWNFPVSVFNAAYGGRNALLSLGGAGTN
jgi:hypothetical protein